MVQVMSNQVQTINLNNSAIFDFRSHFEINNIKRSDYNNVSLTLQIFCLTRQPKLSSTLIIYNSSLKRTKRIIYAPRLQEINRIYNVFGCSNGRKP